MIEVAGNQGCDDPEIKTKEGKDDVRNKYSVQDKSLFDSIEASEEKKLESKEAQARQQLQINSQAAANDRKPYESANNTDRAREQQQVVPSVMPHRAKSPME